MKKKNDDQDAVTKGFLKDTLQNYPTKADLREELEKVDARVEKRHDEVMNAIDGVMKELENMREDNLIGTYQIRELRETSEDHEKRIAKIEQKAA